MLTHLINEHAPLIKKHVRSRVQVPWYSKEIAEARRQRRRGEKVWRRTRLMSDFQFFKKKKNYATFVMNKARQAYCTNIIDENGSDQVKLFKCVKNLLAPKDSLYFPDYNDSRVLANDIREFFFRKINQIREKLDKSVTPEQIAKVPDDHLVNEDQSLSEFQLLSVEDVRNLVKGQQRKPVLWIQCQHSWWWIFLMSYYLSLRALLTLLWFPVTFHLSGKRLWLIRI